MDKQPDRQAQKYNMMTQMKVEPLILKMALPTIVSMLITSIYNMADSYFVGKISTSATAAVGVVYPLMNIIQAVGFFFGHGSGNFISRKLGAKEIGQAEQMASTGFFSSLSGGLLIALLGIFCIHPLALLLGATETILPYAREYLFYVLLGTPFMTAALTLNNQLRFQGNALYAMIGVMSGGILNMALDPLFIFTFGLGVSGAALATSISQLISFVILLVGTNRKAIPIRLKNVRIKLYYIQNIVKGGLPSLFRQGCASVATICLNHAVGGFGDAAIAAFSIVQRITTFASSAMIGYGQGFQPVCGFNYGAGRFDRVKRGFWFCVQSSFLVLLLLAVAGFVFAPQLIEIFRDDPKVIEIGAAALRLQCITFPITGWIVLCNMMAQTIGESLKASLLAMSRQFLFFVPALFLLSAFGGLEGIEWSQPVADVCSLIVSLWVGFSILNQWKTSDPKHVSKQ